MYWRNSGQVIFDFKRFCLAALSLLLAFSAFSQNEKVVVELSPKLQKAYFEIQKLRISTARQLIDSERSTEENNAFIPYLDNYADLHYLLISEDENAYKRLSDQESVRLDLIGKLPDSSPYRRFFQAEIRLHWAFAKLKFGNELSGSWEIIKAYRLLDENYKKFPQFLPTLKSLGLLHVLIGSIPSDYNWVVKILGLKGDIKTGIREIQSIGNTNSIFQQEADLIDLLLHAYTLELTPSQKIKIRAWPREQPDNLLLHFFATTVLMKEGQSQEASAYLSEAPSGPAYIPFPFLDYLRGEISIQKGDYENAAKNYLSFLKTYKGFNYLKDCNLKLFMCHWLAGNDKAATVFVKKIKTTGKTIVEADQFAAKFAAEFLEGKISVQQKILFEARYASDGGYLTEASNLMENVTEHTFSSEKEKAEYNYRRARIFQKSKKNDSAITSYDRVMTFTDNSTQGFRASSALQLGYIYVDRNQKQKAIACFKNAMSFKDHEYKNSIDNKAKAALTELGQ